MKKRLGRELLLLSLPVVLLGGVAFYQARGGRLPASKLWSGFDNGPRRIEFSPLTPVEMTPLDVYSGYDWGVQTTVWSAGKLDVPSSWRQLGGAMSMPKMRLVYRQNAQWKQVKFKVSPLGIWLHGKDMTIKVKLKDVPRDAEEVRLRGHFEHDEICQGLIPRGWVSPSNVKHTGLNHFFSISSEPFDVPIMNKETGWAAPQISQQTKIDVIEGKWLVDTVGRNDWLLWVRAKTDSGLRGELSCNVDDVKFFDATGKPLVVYQDAASTGASFPQGSARPYMSYQMPDNEDIVRMAQNEAQPRGGWGKVKMPIIITGIVSNGECWPTPFKIRVAPEPGESRDYGASSKTIG